MTSWRERRIGGFPITDIDVCAPTQTLAELLMIFPKYIAMFIDSYFRPISSNILDIIWSGYYELCVPACGYLHHIKNRGDYQRVVDESIKPGQLEILKLIRSHETFSPDGALITATIYGRADIVAYLLQDVTPGGSLLDHAIVFATRRDSLDIAELLINHGALAIHGLKSACKEGNIGMVHYMLLRATPMQYQRINQNTGIASNITVLPADDGLIMACANGHAEIAEFLIESGATNFNGGLFCACGNKQHKLIQLMIDYGATKCDHCKRSLEEHRHLFE